MNKLEVGMYVRYKTLSNQIKIAKIIDIDDKEILDLDNKDCTNEKYIIGKPSFNIIDLIEVGDIITYEYPTALGIVTHENVTVLQELLDILKNGENNHEYKIKSIVTNEQFERMKYEVE